MLLYCFFLLILFFFFLLFLCSYFCFLFFFFFFQAEDGIRDLYVTGVQTCALPIWAGDRAAGHWQDDRREAGRPVRDRGDPRRPEAEGQVPARARRDHAAARIDRKSVV